MPDGGRYGLVYCQDQTAFYMIGGGSPATAYTSEVFRYNPATNSWGTGALSTGQVTPQRLGAAAIIVPNTSSAVIYTLNEAGGGGPVQGMQAVQASSGLLANTYNNPTPASTAGLAARFARTTRGPVRGAGAHGQRPGGQLPRGAGVVNSAKLLARLQQFLCLSGRLARLRGKHQERAGGDGSSAFTV